MCAPLVLPIAMLVITAASTVMQVKAQSDAVKSQNAANDYNAAIQNRNATVSNMQANEAIQEGNIQANEHLQNVKSLIGTQRSDYGSSGGLVDSGSSESTVEDSAQFGKLDALTIQSNAARSAWSLQNQSANSTASANLLSASKGSPGAAAAGSALTGISALGSQIYQMKQNGSF